MTGRATFRALQRTGRRVRRGPVAVTWLPGDPPQGPRVAYAVGRPVGGAVERNRLKRRLRAIVRDLAPQLRPGDYLVRADPPAVTLSYEELKEIVTAAMTAEDGSP